MITSKVKGGPEPTIGWQFPTLRVISGHSIGLFMSPDSYIFVGFVTGVVASPVRVSEVGKKVSTWDINNTVEFRGSVELSNE